MRSGPAKHLSDLPTFVETKVDTFSEEMVSATKISAVNEIDLMQQEEYGSRQNLPRVPK